MREHLAQPGEATLARAYDLGRRTIEEGLGVVDLGEMYHRALASALRSARSTGECDKTVQALESFFVETFSPFEMTHRGFRDAHATMRHINELLEDEAKRIAHALHDESGHLLVAVHLALESLAKDLPSGFAAQVQKVRDALDEMESQLRSLSRELRPPILDDLGLSPALRFLAEGFSRRSGVLVVFEGLGDERFPALIEIALYRIVQESLTNVGKHAKASSVVIRFERPDKNRLRCSIRDNGVGFDSGRALDARFRTGLGLAGIQERLKALDGALEIKSRQGGGTELLIQAPVGNERAYPHSAR